MKVHSVFSDDFRRFMSGFIACIFTVTMIVPPHLVYAEVSPGLVLPLPDVMLPQSQTYFPALIKGISLDHNNPLHFRFIVDTGDSGLKGKDLENESRKLIKYFMAGLTTPEKDLWVTY